MKRINWQQIKMSASHYCSLNLKLVKIQGTVVRGFLLNLHEKKEQV